jgi:uncharacterized iron-regulated membrane protein
MMRRSLLKTGKRWLYWSHRWLGIAACLFFLLWFVSGIVMMYVPYPSLTAAERLERAAPIDWRRIAIGPMEALKITEQNDFPRELRLDRTAGEPAWRIKGHKDERFAISAVDGRLLSAPDAASAVKAAQRFASGAPVSQVEQIDDDQWTVAKGFQWARPLWKISLADELGTQLYIASTTGEVVQNTTARERMWNWMGAVPHWLYLTAIRHDGGLWRQVVMWTSGPAVIVGITGLWVGILRVRLRRRYRSGSVSPYVPGWMKWHHITGLIGGLFAITWMASGWLSVNPFDLFARNGPSGGPALYAAHEGADFPAINIARLAERAKGAREGRFSWIGGQPVVTLVGADEQVAIVRPDGAPLQFKRTELIANAQRLMPGIAVRQVALLTEPDLYWYSHGHDRPLPVLRVIFADARDSWAMIDPKTGALLSQQDSSGRTYRWLFNALHDFDLPFLLAHRVLRDPLMWLLSGFGILMSLSGIVIGWRHLVRNRKRAAVHRGRAVVAMREV